MKKIHEPVKMTADLLRQFEQIKEPITSKGDFWRQRFNAKPIKFFVSSESRLGADGLPESRKVPEIQGYIDVVCMENGDCYISIFYAVGNVATGVTESQKLELDQEMFKKIGWIEDEQCFRAIF